MPPPNALLYALCADEVWTLRPSIQQFKAASIVCRVLPFTPPKAVSTHPDSGTVFMLPVSMRCRLRVRHTGIWQGWRSSYMHLSYSRAKLFVEIASTKLITYTNPSTVNDIMINNTVPVVR